MKKRASVRMSAVWMCAGLLLGGAAKKPTTGPAAAVQALYDAGKYPEAIAAAEKALAGSNVPPEDRHIVMVLVAESHLQLKQPEKAVEVLEQAQRQAIKQDRPRDAAEAEAFALLIPESSGHVYAGPGGRYNILDAEERRKAYGALFEERRGHLKEMLERAGDATTLKPIDDIAKEFPAVRELEEAATGEVKQSNALGNQVENRAAEIITGMLDRDEKEIARIQGESNINAAGKIDPRKPGGINDGDRAKLHEMLTECEGMRKTTNQLAEAFRRPWPQPKLLAKAKDTSNRVSAMLEQNRKVGNGKA